jgi:hypothetical protein
MASPNVEKNEAAAGRCTGFAPQMRFLRNRKPALVTNDLQEWFAKILAYRIGVQI